MSVNHEWMSSEGAPSTRTARNRWATCTECGNHFPMMSGDDAAANARLRREQLDAERFGFLARYSTLSDRERAVMMGIARGRMPAQVAQQLGIDVKTVSTYRARLIEKLNLHSNAEIAVAVYKAGLM